MNSFERRSCGLLLPIFSLPGPGRLGGLGAEAGRFIDFLAEAGLRWWQMLPINPIDAFHSPYSSCSTFAGEPLYINLDELVVERLLDPPDLEKWREESGPEIDPSRADYAFAASIRKPLFRKAFERYRAGIGGERYRAAEETFERENAFWLDDHALFRTLADRFGTDAWNRWPEPYRRREEPALKEVRRLSEEKLAFVRFLQLLFDTQWRAFKDQAHQRGVNLLGDVPIYVGSASADTWTHPELFHLAPDGQLKRISGAPADAFNPDGQRWDSPLYNWPRHEATGFDWWIRRLGKSLSFFDAVRLDHFIGYYNFYSFPFTPVDSANAERSSASLTAEEAAAFDSESFDGLSPTTPVDRFGGFWAEGPAEKLLDAVFARFPHLSFIAEDLGVMTPGVHALRDHYELPGMEVLQFSFDGRREGSPDPIPGWPEHSVAYTGTHDTQTVRGWLEELRAASEEFAVDYRFVAQTLWEHLPEEEKRAGHYDRSCNREEVNSDDLTRLVLGALRGVMNSRSTAALFPVQDILGLGSEARINSPGHRENNWLWRLAPGVLNDTIKDRLRGLIEESGR